MRANLDPVSERIPEAADVESSIAEGRVLVIRIDGVLAAYLVFAVRGGTTTLRYWFVRPDFRGRAFGRTLLDRYLASQSSRRRFLLWVDEANSRAVDAYRRAGYRADGLVDVILRRVG
jgi:ribosomal protein S18 acetylase RimI-like enzyme